MTDSILPEEHTVRNNYIINIAAISVLLWVIAACKLLDSTTTNEAANSNEPATNVSSAANTSKTAGPKVEPADITMTAEDLDKEFRDKNVTRDALETKYANKNIAVTGRITLLQTEKEGTVGPWVKLYAPGGIPYGPSCYFDDENASQASGLKRDQLVKVQGFQDSFVVPGVSPRLKHCVLLETR